MRELNGWAPASVTYAPDGEVLSVTVQEPRFTPEDKALLLAARRKDRAPRGSHGLTIEDAADPKNFGRFKVDAPTTDFAAKALHEAQESWRKKHGDQAGMEYLLWRVEKKP